MDIASAFYCSVVAYKPNKSSIMTDYPQPHCSKNISFTYKKARHLMPCFLYLIDSYSYSLVKMEACTNRATDVALSICRAVHLDNPATVVREFRETDGYCTFSVVCTHTTTDE